MRHKVVSTKEDRKIWWYGSSEIFTRYTTTSINVSS